MADLADTMLAASLIVLLFLENINASDNGGAFVHRVLVRVGAQDAMEAGGLRHAVDAALLVGGNGVFGIVSLLVFGNGGVALAEELVLLHER